MDIATETTARIDVQAVRFAMAAFDLAPRNIKFGEFVSEIADATGIERNRTRSIINHIIAETAPKS